MDTKSWTKPKANPPNNHMLLSRQWMLKIIEGLWHAGKQSYTLVVMFVILFLLFFFAIQTGQVLLSELQTGVFLN